MNDYAIVFPRCLYCKLLWSNSGSLVCHERRSGGITVRFHQNVARRRCCPVVHHFAIEQLNPYTVRRNLKPGG